MLAFDSLCAFDSFLILLFFNFIFILCIYSFFFFFLTVLGLRCCVRTFSSCDEQELLFIVVHRLFIAVASLVAELRL